MTRARRRGAGLTMIEVVVSTAIVGGLMVASLNMLAAAGDSRRAAFDRARAEVLAWDLMNEILEQGYADPDADPAAPLGPSAFASQTGNRSRFDFVSDYHGWTESPPRFRNGIIMPEAEWWGRAVTVLRVSPNDPNEESKAETGVKRVTVDVLFRDRRVARLEALRTRGWDALHEPDVEFGDSGNGGLGLGGLRLF